MTKLQQLALHRNAVLSQMDASHKLVDSALMMGKAADVEHLCTHSHNLLTQYHDLSKQYMAEMFRMITEGK